MYTTEIRSIGNSQGAIFPQELLKKLRLGNGDKIFISETPDGFTVSIYDEKLVEQLEIAEDIMREDRSLLKTLAKK